MVFWEDKQFLKIVDVHSVNFHQLYKYKVKNRQNVSPTRTWLFLFYKSDKYLIIYYYFASEMKTMKTYIFYVIELIIIAFPYFSSYYFTRNWIFHHYILGVTIKKQQIPNTSLLFGNSYVRMLFCCSPQVII